MSPLHLPHPLLLLLRLFLALLCVSVSVSFRVSSWPPDSCSRQGLKCTAEKTNCMDNGWLNKYKYTPSAPEHLRVSVETRNDDEGHLQPVLLAEWKIKDDGGISHLNATELHVLVMSTNENRCVRFILRETLGMRSLTHEQWTFFADMLVLDPGETYRVSVFNIPKPELKHSSYDVSQDLSVPGCEDSRMKMTQFCVERGSLWQSNISVSQVSVGGGSRLSVSFSPDILSEEYTVRVRCSTTNQKEQVHRANRTTLNVTFSLDKWPLSCCQFDAEVIPRFKPCGWDCTRHRRTVNICAKTDAPTDAPPVAPPYMFVSLGAVVMCVVAVAVLYFLCRKPGRTEDAPPPLGPEKLPLIKQPPKVLVIYSQDHRLYRDVVLKLCAFLQAKCGTKVLVDLLDTTSVGMVGRLRWLEWQRQQMKNPSDKILVLCSPGVQAKWRAMCGQGRVLLREDVLSPTDDMLTPFLNLFLPDMHQAGMMGKYMVAYFDEICSKDHVPSVFDLAVKYKLMKHFEELYFRILDVEKYQPGQVRQIEGISGDEYFNCPSGNALKGAIETFQAYQLENPDWFEKECVDFEEQVTSETENLVEHMQIPPVLQCVPLIREGPPVLVHDVEIKDRDLSVHVVTPELNPESQFSSVVQVSPILDHEADQYPSGLAQVLTDHVYPHIPNPEPVYVSEPVVNVPPPPRQNWPSVHVGPSGQIPTEEDEEDSLLPVSQTSSQWDQRSVVHQNSLDSNFPESSHHSYQSEHLPPAEISYLQPVEVVEEVLESREKGQSSGSDQGYISKMSSQQDPPLKDPMAALRALQVQLFQDNLRNFDEQPEEN
ncbi:interleukin-17 receptor A [Xyrichtys novacula]|uniref:Interleukin-17 receptor A n=1 Tax=Xyrichtys novacula TaxID=13765 RepID=A0AAV1F3T8_XYRNO|nr:interleukin-17 receptor A [Xyrichtys novacula]